MRRFQVIPIAVASAGAIVNIDFQTKAEHKRIKKIYVVSDYSKNVPTHGSLELKINGSELLPTGFDSQLITSNHMVSRNEVGFDVDMELPTVARITGKFTDMQVGTSVVGVYPYNAYLYLENE